MLKDVKNFQLLWYLLIFSTLYKYFDLCLLLSAQRNVYSSRNWRKCIIKQFYRTYLNMDDYESLRVLAILSLSICIKTCPCTPRCLYYTWTFNFTMIIVKSSSLFLWIDYLNSGNWWRVRFCDKVILSYQKRRILRVFKRRIEKKCRQHLCLDLCLDFSCRRSSDWIKENVTGDRERSIGVCTRVRGRHFFQLSLENPIFRRVTFILTVNSHFGKHVGTETLGVQFGSFPSKI